MIFVSSKVSTLFGEFDWLVNLLNIFAIYIVILGLT